MLSILLKGILKVKYLNTFLLFILFLKIHLITFQENKMKNIDI